MDHRFCIITPCRNEEQFARQTLESVVTQTVPPSLWVIVDDGSTDGTLAILREYAQRYPYIRIIQRQDHGKRNVGPGVIAAFNEGLETVDLGAFDYLCKLDLDLWLPSRYFEILIERMTDNPAIGTCSGKPYFIDPDSGKRINETCGDDHSVGATKFYRVECFRDIGGFVKEVMWDAIDCHTCRMKGWIACSWNDESLRFLHLRPMGSSQDGILTGRRRHGYGQYYMGTSFPYLLASALARLAHQPRVTGAIAIVQGYLASWAHKLPRYEHAEFRAFLRKYQMACLLRGKQVILHATNRRIEEAAEVRKRLAQQPHATLGVVPIRGLPFSRIGLRETVEFIVAEVAAGRGGWVVTPNLDILRRWERDTQFRRMASKATLLVADGMPIVWASKLMNRPLPGRVNGTDLFERLCERLASEGRKVYFLGGEPGAAESSARRIRERHPALQVCGVSCPPFGFERGGSEPASIKQAIARAQPDVVFVGLGCPKQENLIHALSPQFPQLWWLGIGVSFSFVSGQRKRSPVLMQNLGLEWLWRLGQEPIRLLRRYLINGIPYAIGLFGTALMSRMTRRGQRATRD
jgi:exopolysaccharide biosynthesis WecB/TagA/CpsF family protein